MLNERQRKLASRNVTVSCIVPVYNEAEGIKAFLQNLLIKLHTIANTFEIIVVDDGSNDGSATQVIPFTTNSAVKLIKLSRNFGKESALSAGLDHARSEVTILIDADFQHPIETIDAFLYQWSLGFDMVYGIRQNRNHDTWFKRILTKQYYQLMCYITKIDLIPNAGDFRLLDQKVVQALKQCGERNRFMKGLYAWVGFKSIGVPFIAEPRACGTSSWNLRRLAELAITGITSFSNLPLRLWSVTGLIIALGAFMCGGWLIAKTLLHGVDVPGYASIMVVLFFFGGLILSSIGVLGEYIARIFDEVKQRPRYIVDSKFGYHSAPTNKVEKSYASTNNKELA